MKAKDKRTGEIVEIVRYGNDGSYTVFRNSEGELMNLPVSFFDNYEEIVEADKTIDWEERRFELVKAAMMGCIGSNQSERYVATYAVKYADAVIEELKAQTKKMKNNGTKEH